jgi:hypothetical protein
MGQLTAIQTKAFAKFYALLTTDQRTKLDQLQTNGRGMMGPGLAFGPAPVLCPERARRGRLSYPTLGQLEAVQGLPSDDEQKNPCEHRE